MMSRKAKAAEATAKQDTGQPAGIGTVRQLKTVYALEGVKVTHTILDPEQEIPWHRHSEVYDTFYAVKGPVTIQMREPQVEIVLDAGGTHQARIAQPHRVVNLSNHTVEFLLIQGVGTYDFVLENGRGANEGEKQ